MSQQSHLLQIKFEILVPWTGGEYVQFGIWLIGEDMQKIRERLAINIKDSVIPCINVNGIHPNPGRIVSLQKVNYDYPNLDKMEPVGESFPPDQLTVEMLSADDTTYFVGIWEFDKRKTGKRKAP